jgi:hypothetical protein
MSSAVRSSHRRPPIRDAQQSLWQHDLALEGPDTDTLAAPYRQNAGKGTAFTMTKASKLTVSRGQKRYRNTSTTFCFDHLSRLGPR